MTGFINGDKNKAYNELFIPAAEKYFPVLEKILKKSGSGFFGKNGPTWVDFYISEEITTLSGFAPDFFKNYRDLIAFKERVHNLPELKNYIKSRKQTPM
uniref:GST C-terminal domain-containing protein n=1 Tax=Acrobeloides nanus TaxID=290746 RepID=A0A914C439_9BILA